MGMFVQTPRGWTLPEFLTEEDVRICPWLRWQRDAHAGKDSGITTCAVEFGNVVAKVLCG